MKSILFTIGLVFSLTLFGCGAGGNKVETDSGVELQTAEGGGYASSYGTSFYAFTKDDVTLACINPITMSWELTTAKYKLDEASSSITFSDWSRSTLDIRNYSGSKAKYNVADGKITKLVFDNGDEFTWENEKK